MSDNDTHGIVHDGRKRVVEANLAKIEAKIRAKYEKEMAAAGFLRKLFLKAKVEKEIREELEKIAPRGAYYVRGGGKR